MWLPLWKCVEDEEAITPKLLPKLHSVYPGTSGTRVDIHLWYTYTQRIMATALTETVSFPVLKRLM